MVLRFFPLCLKLGVFAIAVLSSDTEQDLSSPHSGEFLEKSGLSLRWLTEHEEGSGGGEESGESAAEGSEGTSEGESGGNGESKEEGDGEKEETEENEDGEEEGEEGEEEEEEVDSTSLTTAILLISFVLLVSTLFMLVNHKDEHIHHQTWFLISNSMSIFIAVTFFQGMDSQLDAAFDETDIHDKRFIVSLLHFTAWYLVVQALSLGMLTIKRCTRKTFQASCMLGAHFCGFAAKDCFTTLLSSPTVAEEFWKTCVGFLLVVAVVALFISCFFQVRKRCVYRIMKARKWEVDIGESEEAIADSENDAFSLSVGFALSQVIRFAIVGNVVEEELGKEDSHYQWQAWLLLGFSYVFGLLGIVCMQINASCSWFSMKEPIRNTISVRVLDIFKMICLMTKAWCILYWGKWEMYDTQLKEHPLLARCALAMMITYYGVFLLFVSDCVVKYSKWAHARRSARLVTLGIGLSVAFAWEACFDGAVEDIAEAEKVKVSEASMKLILCLFLIIVVAPSWFWYVFPRGIEAEEHEKRSMTADILEIEVKEAEAEVGAVEGGKEDENVEKKEEGEVTRI